MTILEGFFMLVIVLWTVVVYHGVAYFVNKACDENDVE